jgi:hypothetical protein
MAYLCAELWWLMPPLPADGARWMGAWRGHAEQRGCDSAMLEKAAAGGPYDREDKWHYVFLEVV